MNNKYHFYVEHNMRVVIINKIEHNLIDSLRTVILLKHEH